MSILLKMILFIINCYCFFAMKSYLYKMKLKKRTYPYYHEQIIPKHLFLKKFKEDDTHQFEKLILNLNIQEDQALKNIKLEKINVSDIESYYTSVAIISSEEDITELYIIEEKDIFKYIANKKGNKKGEKQNEEVKKNIQNNKDKTISEKFQTKSIKINHSNIDPDNNENYNFNNNFNYNMYINEQFYLIEKSF